MSLQDFYGTYQVQTASGTEFGLDTSVVISEGDSDGASVQFTLPSTTETKTLSATYDDTTEALRIELEAQNARVMFISRFVDPTPGVSYRAIYGIVLMEEIEGQVRRSPVWSAKLMTPSVGDSQPTGTPMQPGSFTGTYRVRTTADTQFGLSSVITIDSREIEIVNGLGTSVLTAPLSYEPETASLIGSAQSPAESPEVPVTIAMSLAIEGDTKYLYGTFVIGDPEQGGTYGAEEDDPDDPLKRPSLRQGC